MSSPLQSHPAFSHTCDSSSPSCRRRPLRSVVCIVYRPSLCFTEHCRACLSQRPTRTGFTIARYCTECPFWSPFSPATNHTITHTIDRLTAGRARHLPLTTAPTSLLGHLGHAEGHDRARSTVHHRHALAHRAGRSVRCHLEPRRRDRDAYGLRWGGERRPDPRLPRQPRSLPTPLVVGHCHAPLICSVRSG